MRETANVATQEKNPSLIHAFRGINHAEEGALPRTRRAGNKKKLSPSNARGKALQYRHVRSVGLMDIVEYQDIAMGCASIETLLSPQSGPEGARRDIIQLIGRPGIGVDVPLALPGVPGRIVLHSIGRIRQRAQRPSFWVSRLLRACPLCCNEPAAPGGAPIRILDD